MKEKKGKVQKPNISGKKRPVGRPKIEWDRDLAAKLAMIHCTIEEIAGVMGVSRSFLDHNEEFLQIYKSNSANGKMSLRRWQFREAEAGNPTMLVWLGKQYLGQRDKQDMHIDQPQIINVLIGGKDYKGENEAE